MNAIATRPTCLGCYRPLPRNEVVEQFPFGTRLAYDPDELRLWAVCGKCRKWNLVPLDADERAAAVDSFERWWRTSPTRYSAAGIGVGQYTRDISLVRVGASSWNEFASWRYAGALKRRLRFRLSGGAGAILGSAGFYMTGIWSMVDIVVPMAGVAAAYVAFGPLRMTGRKPVCRIPQPNGNRPLVRNKHLAHLEMIADAARGREWRLNATHESGEAVVRGEEAVRMLSYAMPRVNHFGASDAALTDALTLIAESGGSEGFIETAARPAPLAKRNANAPVVSNYPQPVRVALEIATQEQEERRGMENDLAILRHDWQEAEQIARIADSLLPTRAETR